MDMVEVFKKYRKGLKELQTLFKNNSDNLAKLEKLQQQLLENLDSSETFGDNDVQRQARKPILEKLNTLAYEKLARSFNKICELTDVDISDYRQDFREKVYALYKSLGFETTQDLPREDIRVDFVVHYTMPMKKANQSVVKTIVSADDIIGKESIVRFNDSVEIAQQEGIATIGEVVTDIGFSSEARQYAREHHILLLTYEECIQNLINFDRYFEQLIYDYEHFEEFKRGMRQSFLDILEHDDLHKNYTSPQVSDRNGNVHNSFDTYIESWLNREESSELLLLGDPGLGKTSTLLHLAYQLALKYKQEPERNRIPILMPFKDGGKVFDRRKVITDLLVNRYHLNFSNYSTFEMLLQNQKIIFLLDGLDELMPDEQPRLAFENWLEINRLMVEGGKAIISSDTRYLLNQPFAEEIFSPRGNQPAHTYKPKYDVLFLLELNPKQISDFLKVRTINWQAFYIKIKSIPELMHLATNPIVLDMMWRTLVQVIREKKPFRATSFFEVFTNVWCEREDEDSIMTAEERTIFLEELALEMLRKGQLYLHNTEIPETIRQLFSDYLKDYTEAEVFAYDAGTCPFLLEDLNGNYKFKHKSFLHFFVAKKYIQCLKKGKIHEFKQLKLPFEVKNFIVELMPREYKREDDIYRDMVKIPSGKNTRPFWLDKYPVTNAAYAKFIQHTGFEPPKHWQDGKIPTGKKNHPVSYVSWHDSVLYAKWAGKRLPSAREWEKAVGWEDGRTYPWGNEFNPEICNSIESGKLGTTPVNQFKENISVCGCMDMAGNVWEWTSSWLDEKRKNRGYLAKGGSFFSDANTIQSKNGLNSYELKVDINEAVGFRCAL